MFNKKDKKIASTEIKTYKQSQFCRSECNDEEMSDYKSESDEPKETTSEPLSSLISGNEVIKITHMINNIYDIKEDRSSEKQRQEIFWKKFLAY